MMVDADGESGDPVPERQSSTSATHAHADVASSPETDIAKMCVVFILGFASLINSLASGKKMCSLPSSSEESRKTYKIPHGEGHVSRATRYLGPRGALHDPHRTRGVSA